MNIPSELDQVELENKLGSFLVSIKDQGRTMLLPALIKAQRLFGYISKEHASMIGKDLKVPLADVTGVIEFYSMLSTVPVTKPNLRVCSSPVCIAQGANNLIEQTKEDYSIEKVACLGLCDQAPAVMSGTTQIGQANREKINQQIPISFPNIYGNKILTKYINPDTSPSIEKYLERNGFQALEQVLTSSPKAIIETVKNSGLKGRGGAGFPTGLKWEGAAQTEEDIKYIICNADESEPGTFKDRALLLGDPFSVLEGILIAAYAIGAQKGYFYIRGEYSDVHTLIDNILSQALKTGYLGENIMGKGFNFQLEVRSGAGAYICGEETALFESIEGKRGFPRIKPPFPTTHGLFGKPTVINNVETFANVPIIFSSGVEAYKKMGSESVPGPRLFSLSGDILKPGIYEITQPTTLRELIFDQAGGLPSDSGIQGILFGGAAGKFIGPESLDILLTEEYARSNGLSLGSGAIMVFDQRRNMKEVIASLGHFFAHESCGKCYPCQLGTQRQVEILDRNQNGGMIPGDISRLKDVGWTMTDASLCGLGQTAGLAVLSALDLWPEIFIEKEL
jgi:NADH-quinone oxidoreductase subunit F